jgi:O-antigen ligase
MIENKLVPFLIFLAAAFLVIFVGGRWLLVKILGLPSRLTSWFLFIAWLLIPTVGFIRDLISNKKPQILLR